MFPDKLGCRAMPTTAAFGRVQKWKTRYSKGAVAEQIRELALQLLKKLLGGVVNDDVNVMIACMPENGAGERGTVTINDGGRGGGDRKRLKVHDHSHTRFSSDLPLFFPARR